MTSGAGRLAPTHTLTSCTQAPAVLYVFEPSESRPSRARTCGSFFSDHIRTQQAAFNLFIHLQSIYIAFQQRD